jgi:hypothetical protein
MHAHERHAYERTSALGVQLALDHIRLALRQGFLGWTVKWRILKQQLHHRLVPVCSPRQRRPTIPVLGLQLSALLKQQLHHRLVPVPCSPPQRRPTTEFVLGLQLTHPLDLVYLTVLSRFLF